MKTNKSKKEQIKLNIEKIGVILPSIIILLGGIALILFCFILMRDLTNIIM